MIVPGFRGSALALAALLLLGWPTAGRAVGTDPVRAEARERYERGKQLYEEHDYPGALAELRRTPLSEPLRVPGGAHIVTALAAGYLPARKEVTVAGESSAELKFDLEPSDAKAAHLTVKTALPDAEVVIDGQVVGKTPLPSSLT